MEEQAMLALLEQSEPLDPAHLPLLLQELVESANKHLPARLLHSSLILCPTLAESLPPDFGRTLTALVLQSDEPSLLCLFQFARLQSVEAEEKQRLGVAILDRITTCQGETADRGLGLIVQLFNSVDVSKLLQHPNSVYFWEMFLVWLNKNQSSLRLLHECYAAREDLLPASDTCMLLQILIRGLREDQLSRDTVKFVLQRMAALGPNKKLGELLAEATEQIWGVAPLELLGKD